MFMKDDKKQGGIAVILSKLQNGHSSYEDMKEDNENIHASNEEHEGLEAASSELLSAIDSRDPKAVMEALKAFIEMC